MNKPVQLAFAHRPTAQPGPQFDGPSWTADRQNEPRQTHFGRTNPSAWPAAVSNPLVEPFRHFPQTKPSSANEANRENVVKTMFEDERDESCPHERIDFQFH
jgi:hypothetical protein